MKVIRAAYRDFRNIENAVIEPWAGTNVLYGANAEGKTNALEGLYLFARGRGFRAAHDRELVRFDSAGVAALTLDYESGGRENRLELFLDRDGHKVCRKNGVVIRKMSEFIGHFRAVLFCPAHLGLVRDGPGERRSFLDEALSQISVGYLAALQRYHAILEQRNALIRRAWQDRAVLDATLSVWSEQLAAEAAYIAAKRAEYLEKLGERAGELFAAMTGEKETPAFSYRNALSQAEFLEQLTVNVEREIKYGYTCYGTHRDDFSILLNGREARLYASQGQQRSLVLAMKLAEGEISKSETGEYPVFLFDDVLSELDAARRAFVRSCLSDRQVFITTCEQEPKADEKGVFFVSGGTYTRQ